MEKGSRVSRRGKISITILFIYIILCVTLTRASEINPNNLIKVTPGSDPKCIEYYIYKDEMYCSTTGQNTSSVDPSMKDNERLNIVFDDRPWRLAWGAIDETGVTIEYVPNGESVENWNELVTSQFFPGMQDKVSLKELAEGLMQDLENEGYNPIVAFHENSEDRVIFEFRIEEPLNQIQDEIEMLTKDNKGIYALHYVIKKADMGQENRKKWIQNLKDSTIKENQ